MRITHKIENNDEKWLEDQIWRLKKKSMEIEVQNSLEELKSSLEFRGKNQIKSLNLKINQLRSSSLKSKENQQKLQATWDRAAVYFHMDHMKSI